MTAPQIRATFTPPPPQPPGTLTLVLDEELAQKLRALLGRCNGDIFTKMYDVLNDTLPRAGHLDLCEGGHPYPVIRLIGGVTFLVGSA